MKMTIDITDSEFEELVILRNYFHANPECGPEEQTNTIEYISNFLSGIGIDYIYIPSGGILATIVDNPTGKTLLLRADTDAVPVCESDYNLCVKKKCVSARKGVAHACGHDAHMAMLLIVAKILKCRKPFAFGRILLMFEEGEEGHNNLKQILSYINDKRIRIDSCLAVHVRWDIKSGTIAYCRETALLGKIKFCVDISGNGAHSSTPKDGCNTVNCYHNLYEKLLSRFNLISDKDAHISFAVTSLMSDGRSGFIPDHIQFNAVCRTGTIIATLDCLNSINEICRLVSDAHKCDISVKITRFLFPVINRVY